MTEPVRYRYEIGGVLDAITIDATSTTALNVRKDAAGSTVFVVDTTNNDVTLNNTLNFTDSGTPLINMQSSGVDPPAFTTRSGGTKIVLYDALSGSVVDYAIGIDTSTMWSSVPVANSAHYHRWYGGTTELMNLRGDGALILNDTTGSITGGAINIGYNGGNRQITFQRDDDGYNGHIYFDTDRNFVIENTTGSRDVRIQTNTAGKLDIETKAVIDNTSTEAFLVRKDSDSGDVFTVDTTNSRVSINSPVSATAPFAIGHNAGTTQIYLERDGGGGGLSMFVNASNHAVISNGSGASDIILNTNSFGTIDFTPGGVLSARIVEGSIQAVAGGFNVYTDRTGDDSTAYTMNAYTFTDDATAASGTSATDRHTMNLLANTIAATNTSVTTTNAATLYIAGAPIAGTNQTITNPYALLVDSGDTKLDDRLLLNSPASASDYPLIVGYNAGASQIFLERSGGGGGLNMYVDSGTHGIIQQTGGGADLTIRASNNIYLKDGGGTTVFGTNSTQVYSEVPFLIDDDSTTALVVRKDDNTEILTVDTINSRVLFGDANFFNNFNGTDPVIAFDSGDSMQFDRSANKYLFRVASSNKLTINASTIVSEVQHIVDSTSTEAFLVRKETDGGDIFLVDTTNSVVESRTILPLTTETYDLGSASLEWNNIYSQNAVTVSDANKKKDIVDEQLGLDFITKLEPKEYRYKSNNNKGHGLIAQEVETLLEESNVSIEGIVSYSQDEEGVKSDYGLNYMQLIGPLINAIKELQKQIAKGT